ncbi:MAG TPA: nicotinate-nucleotide adenylyltransferase [Hyphomicrobiaceae bacterium]|nr:nicotinate-nucleotide adenylyltransferase [Hyphomicrobiaceae bacterium]
MRKSAPVTFGSLGVRLPLALPGQRIGLLGGSFNPPHAAHVLVSRIALARLRLDRIWWIVTPGNPLKKLGQLAPLDVRLMQCRALARDPRIVVTGFESGLGTSFTAATLAFLKRRQPALSFVWVMGADCLVEFHRWRQWRDIFRLMPVAVVDRPGQHLKAMSSPAARTFSASRWPRSRAAGLADAEPPAWTMLTGPLSPLSSTALRRARPEPPKQG